ncbi:hypothetical protein [Methylobacterium dankookense]|uniref:hypothetical protein n=1 Tax=Methylobacterium dankookense TaxID=560405 RepID=UPI0011A3D4C4|nr:hypothetical protein [Methylobacterium dankookense]
MRYREIIAIEAATEAGIIKPEKPLTPVQQRRRQEKNAATEKRIRDEETSSSRKIADLRGRLV